MLNNNFFIKKILTSLYHRQKEIFIVSILLFCPVILFSQANAPALIARDWIKQMLHAMHSTNYNQTFIYENSLGIFSVRLMHARLDGHEYERLTFLNGPLREFLRKDRKTIGSIIHESSSIFNLASVFPFKRKDFDSLVQKIGKLYQFRLKGSDRVADHDCVKISITPNDTNRYGYLLWIDKANKVLLRAELHGENASVLDRFMVVHFQQNSALKKEDFLWEKTTKTVRPNIPTKHKIPQTEKEKQIFPWSIGWLPKGYHFYKINTLMSPVNHETVNHILYSDGISSFSVYVEKGVSGNLKYSAEKFGANSAAFRVFKLDKSTYYSATIVGELPLATAERIVTSIHKKSAEE